MTSAISGPGMLWVRSRIAPESKEILDEHTFVKWYDEEHIPEVVSTSGIRSGCRYIDVRETSPCGGPANSKPFLAFYPMSDLAFTQGEEFKKISIRSDSLPGSGIVYDMADFDVSYMRFLDSTGSSKGSANYLLTCGISPADPPGLDTVNSFYEAQISQLAKEKGYSRTLRFQLQYARTNAQSRALKGLPTTDETHPEPPIWLAIHEFQDAPEDSIVTSLEQDTVQAMAKHDWGATHEMHLWKLEKVHGEGKFF